MNPQAELNLQKPETEDKSASGFNDPCLVFLEADDQGFPLLVACWAQSSTETKKPGETPLLELRDVLLLGWYPDPESVSDLAPWLFRTGKLDSLQIAGSEPEIRLSAPEKPSPFDSLGLGTLLANRMHVRPLNQEEMRWLGTSFTATKMNHASLANLMLKLVRLNWPSMSEASRSLHNQNDRNHLSHEERRKLASGRKRATVKLGNLLTIADQIQAFGFARKTGEIYIANVPPPARINLVDGELVDAQFGLLSGIDAAIALINMKDPQTEFIVGVRGYRRTIDLPFTHVLCEAARIKDETPEPAEPEPIAPERVAPNTPYLRITLGTETKTFPIRPGITYIGRASLNDIVINDSTLSHRHASLEYSPAGILLKDLGSTNGTYLAGEVIKERWLGAQERVQFGGVHCLFSGLKR